MHIGVFDSGKGGLSVANAIRKAYPEHEVEFVCDAEHVPYGDKPNDVLLELTIPILHRMAEHCDVIVIACNTLTTNVIAELRQAVPVPLIGIEPMVKPAAALTRSGIIAVCATPATLASRRYARLKELYTAGIKVLEPDCSQWARMIESNGLRRQQLHDQIDALCNEGADVIVLGCTHYHWIEEMVKESAAGRAAVIQPEEAIIRRLGVTLNQLQTAGQA
jgi:glutamate racemase